jgi:site-specific DNA recombinase
MRIAIYVRVSTQRQAQTQTIDQQLDRLRRAAADRQWPLTEDHIFRDDGYSGASLRRPGLDKLCDLAARAKVDRILITDPDRLARNYVHQVLLLEELQRHGCRVEFIDRSSRRWRARNPSLPTAARPRGPDTGPGSGWPSPRSPGRGGRSSAGTATA